MRMVVHSVGAACGCFLLERRNYRVVSSLRFGVLIGDIFCFILLISGFSATLLFAFVFCQLSVLAHFLPEIILF